MKIADRIRRIKEALLRPLQDPDGKESRPEHWESFRQQKFVEQRKKKEETWE